jgi:diguanylate cyclase (GGDEF)-like protein
LTLGALAVIGYFLCPVFGLSEDGQTFYYVAISAATTVAVIVGAARTPRRRRLPWLLLAAGQLSYTIGDIWYYVAHAVYQNEAFPAEADLFYLLQYPLIGLALVLLVHRRTPFWDAPALLDATVLAISVGMLWWVYLIRPLASADASESMAATVVSIAYPVMDLVVLTVAVRLAVGAGARSAAFRLLMASLAAMLLGDLVYGLQTATDTYQDGGIPDLFWLSEYILLGTAALHPTMRTLDQRAKVALPGGGRRRLAVLVVAALLPLVVLYVQYRTGELSDAPVLMLCAACLFALVITRMWVLIGIQRKATITDALTGLRAPGVLLSHLDLECVRATEQRHELGVLLLDIDQFKLIVQIYGQPAGDAVLCELVNRLVQLCGRTTVLGRIGDNTFAMILPGFDRWRLGRAGAQIREVVEATKFAVDETDSVRVTVSVGIASLFTDGTKPVQLLDRAQTAIHRAKTAGRNRVFSTVGQIR